MPEPLSALLMTSVSSEASSFRAFLSSLDKLEKAFCGIKLSIVVCIFFRYVSISSDAPAVTAMGGPELVIELRVMLATDCIPCKGVAWAPENWTLVAALGNCKFWVPD